MSSLQLTRQFSSIRRLDVEMKYDVQKYNLKLLDEGGME